MHRVVNGVRDMGASGIIGLEGRGFHTLVFNVLRDYLEGDKVQIEAEIERVYSPVWAGNMVAMARYANSDEDYADGPWEKYFTEIFGDAGPDVFRAVQLSSQVILSISRIGHSLTEGFSWWGFYAFRGSGDFSQNMAPPEHVLQGAYSMKEIVAHFEKSPWREDALAAFALTRETPDMIMERAVESARRAQAILEEAKKESPHSSRIELERVMHGAGLCRYFGEQWLHLCRARVAYAGVLSPADAETRREAAQLCRSEFIAAINALKTFEPHLMALYPGGKTKFIGHVEGRLAELASLDADFAPLLAGKSDKIEPKPVKPTFKKKGKTGGAKKSKEEAFRSWREMGKLKPPKRRQT